jgi:hypothetical protein
MVERPEKRRPIRQKTTEYRVAGIKVASVTTTEFAISDLPKPVRRSLEKSSVPEELYKPALEVLSVAYYRVKENWTSEVVGETPDLPYVLPGPVDIDTTLNQIRGKVGIDDLVELSRRMFGKTDTAPEVLMSMRSEIDLLFNPPEQKK